MAETAGASPAAPQRALLDLVARSDVYLLLLGRRYGERGASGLSPTEEEFEEANRRRKPIIALRQNVDMDPEQLEFLERVRGNWERGRLYDTFEGANDVALKVVRALTNVRQLGNVEELAPQAQQRASALAHGEPSGGFGRYGSRARIAFVPLIDGLLPDEVALDDADSRPSSGDPRLRLRPPGSRRSASRPSDRSRRSAIRTRWRQVGPDGPLNRGRNFVASRRPVKG